MRDEGHRYDPALARICYTLVIELFQRRLGEGDLPAKQASESPETKH
jgi:carboxymethylenebutenolidase